MAFSKVNRSRLETEVDELVSGWIGITAMEDPAEFKAWTNYRQERFNCAVTPKGYTVPTEFPPATMEAVATYDAAIAKIRECVGWKRAGRRKNVIPFLKD